jgi:hypothetical protein
MRFVQVAQGAGRGAIRSAPALRQGHRPPVCLEEVSEELAWGNRIESGKVLSHIVARLIASGDVLADEVLVAILQDGVRGIRTPDDEQPGRRRIDHVGHQIGANAGQTVHHLPNVANPEAGLDDAARRPRIKWDDIVEHNGRLWGGPALEIDQVAEDLLEQMQSIDEGKTGVPPSSTASRS